MAAREAARPAGEVGVWCRWRLSLPLVLLSRREHAAKARGAPAIGGDWWRASAGIGGHWRALVGAVAAGISARFADALFDMHVGLGALHSSGVRVLLADEPTSRRADEPTSRRADEPTSRRADEPTSRRADEPTSRRADEPTSRRADEPTSRRADEPTSRRADEPTSRRADTRTDQPFRRSMNRFPCRRCRAADSPTRRFTDLPIYRFTDSPAHAARRCRGPAARSVRSSAPAFIPPRHDGRPPSPGRSKPHGGAAISAAHRAPPPSIPSKLTAVVSHEFFSCLS
ncbi:putative sR protein factor [Burkholderia pseudomallei 576]|nr:putative sR protein factor [Burkholderia pseudomallei 576]